MPTDKILSTQPEFPLKLSISVPGAPVTFFEGRKSVFDRQLKSPIPKGHITTFFPYEVPAISLTHRLHTCAGVVRGYGILQDDYRLQG